MIKDSREIVLLSCRKEEDPNILEDAKRRNRSKGTQSNKKISVPAHTTTVENAERWRQKIGKKHTYSHEVPRSFFDVHIFPLCFWINQKVALRQRTPKHTRWAVMKGDEPTSEWMKSKNTHHTHNLRDIHFTHNRSAQWQSSAFSFRFLFRFFFSSRYFVRVLFFTSTALLFVFLPLLFCFFPIHLSFICSFRLALSFCRLQRATFVRIFCVFLWHLHWDVCVYAILNCWS